MYFSFLYWIAGENISNKQTNSVAFSPQANYTDWATGTCWQNLVPTFVARGVSRGQRGRPPTVINLSFLDRMGENISNDIIPSQLSLEAI
jgi:hypothetical protein